VRCARWWWLCVVYTNVLRACAPPSLRCVRRRFVLMYKWDAGKALELIERERATDWTGECAESRQPTEAPACLTATSPKLFFFGGRGCDWQRLQQDASPLCIAAPPWPTCMRHTLSRVWLVLLRQASRRWCRTSWSTRYVRGCRSGGAAVQGWERPPIRPVHALADRDAA
jgi:hypothetical protein